MSLGHYKVTLGGEVSVSAKSFLVVDSKYVSWSSPTLLYYRKPFERPSDLEIERSQETRNRVSVVQTIRCALDDLSDIAGLEQRRRKMRSRSGVLRDSIDQKDTVPTYLARKLAILWEVDFEDCWKRRSLR